MVGLSLIPAFGTLYQRLTLGESTRFLKSKNLPDDEGSTSDIEDNKHGVDEKAVTPTTTDAPEAHGKTAHFTGVSSSQNTLVLFGR